MPIDKLIDLGIDLGERAANVITGMGMEKWELEQKEKFANKMMDKQAAINKQQADYSQGLQMKMWNDTNAEAQRKHYEDAGLNVGLMYEGGGAGGATTGSANAGSVSASVPGGGEGLGIGLKAQEVANQSKMAQSQIELQKSQAELNNAQTAKISGADTTKIGAETENIGQQTKNAKAQEEILKVDKQLKEIEAYVGDRTKDDVIHNIQLVWERGNEELEAMARNNSIGWETKADAIKQMRQATIEQAAKILAIKEGIKWDYGDTATVERYMKMAEGVIGSLKPSIRINKTTKTGDEHKHFNFER